MQVEYLEMLLQSYWHSNRMEYPWLGKLNINF